MKLEGLPEGLLHLEAGLSGLVVVPDRPGATLEGRQLPAGERRLVRPGECLRAAGWTISLAPGPSVSPDGTAALARAALAGAIRGQGQTAVPTLVWLTGRDCGLRMPLLDEATYLGRGEGAAARVRDALASRRHAKLVLKSGAARLVDLDSANGLFVNGQRIQGERVLAGGEIIRLGHTELAFEAPASAAPRPMPEPTDEEQQAPRPEPPTAPRAAPPAMRRLTALELALVGFGSASAAFGVAAAWLLLR